MNRHFGLTSSRLPASHIHIDIKRDEEIPVRRKFGELFLIATISVAVVELGFWLGRILG